MPRIKVPKEKRLAFLADYEELGTVSAVARKWDITSAGASYILSLMGAKTEGFREAARRVNRKRAGIKDDRLDEPTEEGSYWIGFLAADGCIYRRKDQGQKQIILTLAKKDEGHLLRFVDFFGGRKPRTIKRAASEEATVRICSDKLAGVLAQYGVVERKTKTIMYNGQSLAEYEPAYLRGLIDGDGCIYRQKNGYLRVCFTIGGKPFLVSFLQRMNEMGFVFSESNRSTYWNLTLSGKPAERFCSFLYEDCSICLDRKRKIYDKTLSE